MRAALPERATVLGFMSAQGLVNQMAMQFAAMFNNPDLKAPADLPKDPALVGMAVTLGEPGYGFRIVVPSRVGEVVEKGLVPLFQSMAGQVNR